MYQTNIFIVSENRFVETWFKKKTAMLNRPNFLMLNIPNESRPTCKDEHFGIKNSKNLHLPGSHSQPLNNDIDTIISHAHWHFVRTILWGVLCQLKNQLLKV